MGIFRDIAFVVGLVVMAILALIATAGIIFDVHQIRETTALFGWTLQETAFVGLTLVYFLTIGRVVYLYRELQKRLQSVTRPPAFSWSGNTIKGKNYYYGHATFTNTGGSTATRCRVQAENLRDAQYLRLVQGFSPFILKWDGHQGKEREVGIDVDAGQSAPLTVCASPLNYPPQWRTVVPQEEPPRNPIPGVRFVLATDALSVANVSFDPGAYYVTLRILGTNIKGTEVGVTEDFLVKVGDTPESLEFCVDPYKHSL